MAEWRNVSKSNITSAYTISGILLRIYFNLLPENWMESDSNCEEPAAWHIAINYMQLL